MFAIDVRSLPSCGSYREAVRLHDNAHASGKFPVGWRGLKNKRDETKLVSRFGDEIAFRLHNTNVVTWMPKEVQIGFYNSQSTILFANQFLPDGLSVTSIRGDMYAENHEGVFRPKYSTLDFHLEDGRWKVNHTAVDTPLIEVLDLKKAAAIRKIMNPFFEWELTLERLGVPLPPAQGTADQWYRSIQDVIKKGEIKPEEYLTLRSYPVPICNPMHDAYILGRARYKAFAKFGARPKKPPPSSNAWLYV